MSRRPVLRVQYEPHPAGHDITLSEAGGKFIVAIRPLPADEQSLTSFGCYLDARAHARFLRFAYGGTIADQVDPAVKRQAEAAEQARLAAKRGNA